jgi:hypothetical protein
VSKAREQIEKEKMWRSSNSESPAPREWTVWFDHSKKARRDQSGIVSGPPDRYEVEPNIELVHVLEATPARANAERLLEALKEIWATEACGCQPSMHPANVEMLRALIEELSPGWIK